MTQRVEEAVSAKSMTRRRRVSDLAARRRSSVRLAKTDRKQTIRQSGRRRGGR